MRYFQKVMRRADIDIQYSAGYSPHQIMSFASPLGLGLTSEGEYMDIEVGTSASSEESLRRLNAVMADGMEVLSYKELPAESKNAMSIVAGADYTLTFREGQAPEGNWQDQLREFYARPAILITKKTKKSEREVDLKPHIHALSVEGETIYMRLTAGSVENIKPELVMEAFFQDAGITLPEYSLLIHRLDLLADVGEEGRPVFCSLDDFGKEIL